MSDHSQLIVANWKSNKTIAEVESWLKEWSATKTALLSGLEIAIAPTYPHLAVVHQWLQKDDLANVKLAVQDISPFPAGSYTGAVTVANLEGLNIKYALVGHSERRRYFHETHTEVANKVEQAVQVGITPIVCVDAEYAELQAAALDRDVLKKCVVAYEPLEAIGNDHNQSATEIEPVVRRIREIFGSVRVLYGGSAAAENVREYRSIVDGFLVGHKSLQADSFAALLTAATHQ